MSRGVVGEADRLASLAAARRAGPPRRDPPDLERLETEAAEIVGAMKDLFREFEKQLGEIISVQRIASTEAQARGAQVSKDLHELNRPARALLSEQRDLVARLEREWQLRIDPNAQRAGEAQAQAFGENIIRGLQGQLEKLTADVRSTTRHYTWRSSLQWCWGSRLRFR